MKTYNIDPQEIQIADFTMTAITLGEKGRGRTIVNVACPNEFTFLEPGQTRSGKPRLVASQNDSGWVARINTHGSYVRGASGNVSVSPEHKDAVSVLARGQGAFGAAGRTGTWDDIIVVSTLDSFWLRVKPSRGDAYVILFSEEKFTQLEYEDFELLLDSLDYGLHDSSPRSRGNLIRL